MNNLVDTSVVGVPTEQCAMVTQIFKYQLIMNKKRSLKYNSTTSFYFWVLITPPHS